MGKLCDSKHPLLGSIKKRTEVDSKGVCIMHVS